MILAILIINYILKNLYSEVYTLLFINMATIYWVYKKFETTEFIRRYIFCNRHFGAKNIKITHSGKYIFKKPGFFKIINCEDKILSGIKWQHIKLYMWQKYSFCVQTIQPKHIK